MRVRRHFFLFVLPGNPAGRAGGAENPILFFQEIEEIGSGLCPFLCVPGQLKERSGDESPNAHEVLWL